MPLDPNHITPAISLNRVKLMSAPGLPAAWVGKTSYQIMGRETLLQRIGEGLPDLTAQADPIPAFNDLYLARQHPAATAIADDMGRALGCLLLTLKLGEAANRAARAEWDDSYWDYWGHIEHVILGGGIMAGLLGRHMRDRAAAMLDGYMSLTIADYPAALPLIGAARMAAPTTVSAWVFDFGGTNVKRGHVQYANQRLTTLELLPTVLIPPLPEATDLWEFMLTTIMQTVGPRPNSDAIMSIHVSLASYLHQCRFAVNIPDRPYGRLQTVTGSTDLCRPLSDALTQRSGLPVTVSAVHDGTAAAQVYAGARHTAVIVVGTALGIGFPPIDSVLIPLSDTFSVRTVS